MQERRKISSRNLALLLVYDLLIGRGIEAREGPIKQAVLRHKSRLHAELQKIKVKRGAKSNKDLAQTLESTAGDSLTFSVALKQLSIIKLEYRDTYGLILFFGLSKMPSNIYIQRVSLAALTHSRQRKQ